VEGALTGLQTRLANLHQYKTSEWAAIRLSDVPVALLSYITNSSYCIFEAFRLVTVTWGRRAGGGRVRRETTPSCSRSQRRFLGSKACACG
jgi:hypothetical protein